MMLAPVKEPYSNISGPADVHTPINNLRTQMHVCCSESTHNIHTIIFTFTKIFHIPLSSTLSKRTEKKTLGIHGNEPKKNSKSKRVRQKKRVSHTHNVQEEPTINGKATNITNKMRSE